MADSEPLSAAPSTPAAESLGQTLRNARVAHDLTVEQIAAELRIEAKQLKALEENRFEQIGVPVFVKGYLRAYGQRIGLDPRDLLARYHQQVQLAEVQIRPSRTIKLRDERQITSWLLGGIVLLTVVVALAVWWWNGGSFEIARPSATAAAVAPATAVTAPERRPATQPVATPAAVPAAQADNESDVALTAAPDAANGAPLALGDVGAAANVAAESVFTIPLAFTFDQESWAEVTDGRGERLLFGLNVAGRRVTVRGEPPFAVVLGNGNAVRLVVDGEPYPIPTTGRQGNLARFSVDIAEE